MAASKFELASYLSSLASILDQQDKSGTVNRSATLGQEYQRVYDELKDIIQKEQGNETRTSNDKSGRFNKAGAEKSGR